MLDTSYKLLQVKYGTNDGKSGLIRLAIVKDGMTPNYNLNFESFDLAFWISDKHYVLLPKLITSDRHIYTAAGKTFAGLTNALYAVTPSGPYAAYKIKRPDGRELPLKDYAYDLDLQEGLNEFVIEVSDVARLMPVQSYTLHLWIGDSAPAGFEFGDGKPIRLSSTGSMVAVPDPGDPFIILIAANDFADNKVRFRPVYDSPPLTLEGVYSSSGIKLELNPQGYYEVPLSEKYDLGALFSNGSQKFAYFFKFYKGVGNVELDYVTVWAASDIELGRAYVRGGKDIYYQVPEELDYFKIKPTLTPDNEEFGVWIGNDGMSSIYDDSEKGRGPVYLKYEPGSPDPIPITITSAYDLTRKDYLLYLTKTPVLCAGGGNSELLPGGLTCADASYDTSYGTSGITWTQMEQSTDGRTRSYYAYVPDSVSKVDLTFEFENPAVTEDVYLILPDDSQEYFANLPVTKTISLASGEAGGI